MMKSWKLEEDKNLEKNIVRDVKNLRLTKLKQKNKTKTNDTAIKDIRNLFSLKENKVIKIEYLEILGIFWSMEI